MLNFRALYFLLTIGSFTCLVFTCSSPAKAGKGNYGVGNGMNSGWISVLEYGAVGDGRTDDTEAIRKALAVAEKNQRKGNNTPRGQKTKVYFGTTPTVYFPSGEYLISGRLKLPHFASLRGDGAILFASSSYRGECFLGVGWQLTIEGLQFADFTTAIEVNNNNLDIGRVIVRDCSFFENDLALSIEAQSSLTIIESNRFIRNGQVLYLGAGDLVSMRENWISTGQLTGRHPAVIENRGRLEFQENLLVPSPPTKGTFEPAWINNYGSVTVRGIRQGGEPGSFTLINNFAEADLKYPIVPNSVVVRDSECYGVFGNRADYRQPAVVRFIEVPNLTICDGIRGVTDAVIAEWSESSKRREIPKDKKIKLEIVNSVGGYFSRAFE